MARCTTEHMVKAAVVFTQDVPLVTPEMFEHQDIEQKGCEDLIKSYRDEAKGDA